MKINSDIPIGSRDKAKMLHKPCDKRKIESDFICNMLLDHLVTTSTNEDFQVLCFLKKMLPLMRVFKYKNVLCGLQIIIFVKRNI